MFSIELDPEVHTEEDAQFFQGRITLGDHSESFLAAASPWDADRYRRQWHNAAQHLANGAERTGFITSFVHPDAHHTFVWAAWRIGNLVHFQELLLLRERLPAVLDVDRIDRFIPGHQPTTEDGHAISEWVVPIEDLAAFAA
jgi:hypothetical protein